jgi:pimeloyl-ACP methyl ester carboxylesterase
MDPRRRVVRQVEAGAGEPAVVLEAGLSNGAASWQRVMPLLAGHSWGGILVQLLAFRRPDLVAGLVLVDPGHEEMESLLPLPVRWGWRIMRTVFPDELHADAPVTSSALRELRAAARPLPDVPVVVLSAARGFPRRFRAHWTRLQAGLAAGAPQGRHVVVNGTGHNIPRDQPDIVASTILTVTAQARTSGG